MVERDLAKVEVASSNLVSRSKNFHEAARLDKICSESVASIIYNFDILIAEKNPKSAI